MRSLLGIVLVFLAQLAGAATYVGNGPVTYRSQVITTTTTPPTTLAHAPAWYSDARAYIWNFDETHPGSSAIDSGVNHVDIPDPGSCASSSTAWQGTKSCDWSGAPADLSCSPTCSDNFQGTTTDFTAGATVRSPVGGAVAHRMIMSSMGSVSFAGTPGWGFGWGATPDRFLFEIRWGTNPSYADLYTDPGTYVYDTWAGVVVRFTNSTKLMENFINGVLMSPTTTAGAAPAATTTFHLSGSSTKLADEYWFFKGKLANADILRIYVCGWDGVNCQCDWAGTPANYTSRPRWTSGTMPACNVAGPQ